MHLCGSLAGMSSLWRPLNALPSQEHAVQSAACLTCVQDMGDLDEPDALQHH